MEFPIRFSARNSIPISEFEEIRVHQNDLWTAGGFSTVNGVSIGIARIHLDSTGFEGWLARHLSYADLQEENLGWQSVMIPGERTLMFLGQDPRSASFTPFQLDAHEEEKIRLALNPDASDVTISLLYSEDLRFDDWNEFARKEIFETIWTITDSLFSIEQKPDGILEIDPALLEARKLFIKAEAFPASTD